MQEYIQLDQPEILSRLFYPRRESKTRLPEGAVDVDFEMESGVALGCRFHIHDMAAPSIIYFHGNGEIVCDHDEIGREYMNIGCNLLVMSYRGYGWSSGTPTVHAMFNDGRNLFLETIAWLRAGGYTGPLFLMGRSLGSACAIDLAFIHGDTVKGLIIESGFADTLPLLEVLGISQAKTGIREEEGFRNKEKIAKVKIPTLILHGARDQLIPPSEAERLQANSGARNKQFYLIPGADHNTMISSVGKMYFQTIRQFIDAITGASSWRNKRKLQKSGPGETS
jgi:uncharacterized protein